MVSKKRGKYVSRKIRPSGFVFCSTCNHQFKRLAILEHHIKSVHLNYRSHCPICPRKFISKSVCRRHIKETHDIQSYSKLNIDFSPSKSQTESINFNLMFPTMLNAVVLKRNQMFGNHLIASRDLEAGERVLAAEAFASIEYVSCTDTSKCFNCGRHLPEDDKIQCDYCIDVFFCNRKCSSNRQHKAKCNPLHCRTDCKSIRLVTEILNIASKRLPNIKLLIEFCEGIMKNTGKPKELQPPYSEYGLLLQLKFKAECHHYSIAERAVSLVKCLPQFNSATTKLDWSLFRLAFRHAISLQHNAFSEEKEISQGGTLYRYSLYDILSIFNHSCNPNINSYIDDDDITYCETARAIKKGQQLFINYLGENFKGTDEERQLCLEKNWDFKCKCKLCVRKQDL